MPDEEVQGWLLRPDWPSCTPVLAMHAMWLRASSMILGNLFSLLANRDNHTNSCGSPTSEDPEMRLQLTKSAVTAKDTRAPSEACCHWPQAMCTVVRMLSMCSSPAEPSRAQQNPADPQPPQAPTSYGDGPCPWGYRTAGKKKSVTAQVFSILLGRP